MITGDPMINKKKNTKKDDTSNSTVIKVMLLGFLGGNMIYAVIAFLTGDIRPITIRISCVLSSVSANKHSKGTCRNTSG